MTRMAVLDEHVSRWGNVPGLPEHMRRRLRIFNLLNFFGLVTGLAIPLAGLLNHDRLPPVVWMVACSPSFISGTVLLLTRFNQHKTAYSLYFIFYPLFTALVYLNNADLGLELFFILYGVLSIFFLNNIRSTILCASYCMAGYLLSQILPQTHFVRLVEANPAFFIANQALSGFLIFYALILLKKEGVSFESQLRATADDLERSNAEIKQQGDEIKQKAAKLEIQASELAELNKLKNKLFSVVSHDLRNPVHALKNYFNMAHTYNIPAEDLKNNLPEIINDLNYTSNLLENLLAWSKSQLSANDLFPEEINIADMIEQVVQLLRLQAENKKIKLANNLQQEVFAFADPASVQLVLRNLVSNAIKYSPLDATIEIGAERAGKHVRVYVKDYGTGMDPDQMNKILNGDHLSVAGTAQEQGTGLGLLLCKEYLSKINGSLQVESEKGKGSLFSFVIPLADAA